MSKKPTLDELVEMFSGKGGKPESESIIVDNNSDKKDGFVSVFSNKADIAKIIKRCKSAIIDYELIGDGVQLKIARKAFRGTFGAFKVVKEKV